MNKIHLIFLMLFWFVAGFPQQDTTAHNVLAKYTSIQVEKIDGLNYQNKVTYYKEKLTQNIIAFENKKIKWRADVMTICGKPFVGEPIIRSVELKGLKLYVVSGKHDYSEIDINTGEVHCLGSD